MSNKILEIIVEPTKLYVGSTFRLKVKVEFTPSYALTTQNSESIITEDGAQLITNGDYYE